VSEPWQEAEWRALRASRQTLAFRLREAASLQQLHRTRGVEQADVDEVIGRLRLAAERVEQRMTISLGGDG
jgi:hypothetical protein